MASNSLTAQFENLPWIAKIIILLFLGWIISPIYRILRFLETKNTVTLVVGILGLCTGIGNVILEVVDIVTEVLHGKITFFAD